MVEGRSPIATVVDLDGTWVNGNTLHIFISVALRFHLRHLHLSRVTGITGLCAKRLLKVIPHTTMRKGVIALAGNDEELYKEFATKILRRVNPEVNSLLTGDCILLATAAAETYIPAIWKGEYVASPLDGPDLRGETKLTAVKNWLRCNGASIGTLITDHYDDLPLALYANSQGAKVYLVNPSAETVSKFSAAGVNFTGID